MYTYMYKKCQLTSHCYPGILPGVINSTTLTFHCAFVVFSPPLMFTIDGLAYHHPWHPLTPLHYYPT